MKITNWNVVYSCKKDTNAFLTNVIDIVWKKFWINLPNFSIIDKDYILYIKRKLRFCYEITLLLIFKKLNSR